MKSILSIFVIAVCVGTYFVYIKPLSIDVRVLNAKKEEYTNVLNRVKEIKEKRDQVLLEYDSISPEDIDRLNKIIPEKVNSVVLLNDLNNIGSKYGIVIRDFKVNESNDSNSREDLIIDETEIYKTTSVVMSLSGQYSQFLGFLDEVESGLSLFDIVNLGIKQGTTQGNNQPNLNYSLEANIYSLR